MCVDKIFLHYKRLDGKVGIFYIFAGIFGFIGISIALIPLNYITAPPPFTDNSRGTLEATTEALIEIGNNNKLLIAVIGQFIISFFYFFCDWYDFHYIYVIIWCYRYSIQYCFL